MSKRLFYYELSTVSFIKNLFFSFFFLFQHDHDMLKCNFNHIILQIRHFIGFFSSLKKNDHEIVLF